MAARGGREEALTWLLLKHFPKWLTAADKEGLLTHFGATQVVVMPTRGKMKNCVFAAFSPADSTQAMGKLHQLEVFGGKLIVEYAHSAHQKLMLEAEKDKWCCNTSSKLMSAEKKSEKEAGEKESKPKPAKEDTRSPSPDPDTGVPYLYPPATPTTLTNITSALVCVPQFYQQVLHLMNLMSLPPPFGTLTPVPPPIHLPLQGEEEKEESSELESDEEERERRKKRTRSPVAPHEVKRRKISYQQVKTLQTSLKKVPASLEEPHLNPSTSRLKISLNVPSELVAHPEEEGVALPTTINYIESGSTSTVATPTATTPTSTSAPVPAPAGLTQTPPQTEDEGGAFITSSELNSKRLTPAEMQDSHVYKSYSAGEVSTRLYVKNLAKQVEEKDLRYIFGRYIDWRVEEQKNMFDIRLMQTGRMKGQAFVGLSGEGVASHALQETNGYVLHGKPMVVHFARSSKPKDQQTRKV